MTTPPEASTGGLLARIGPVHRWRAVLRSEVRKTTSVRLYWLLLIPVVVLALVAGLLGSLIAPPDATGVSSLLLAGLAATLSLVSSVGAAFGALTASGEYRHRTVTQAFLTGSRGQVLGSTVVVVAVVAAVYGLLTALLGTLLGSALLGGEALPGAGTLAWLGLVGIAVCALWGVLGVAVGTLVPNQAGATVLVVGYSLFGENLLALIMRGGGVDGADQSVVARLTSFLPGNAGDVALYQSPAREVGQGLADQELVESLAGVSAPPPGWVALLVLLGWTVAAVALAAVVGGRRDIS